jgi:hypothetical protein
VICHAAPAAGRPGYQQGGVHDLGAMQGLIVPTRTYGKFEAGTPILQIFNKTKAANPGSNAAGQESVDALRDGGIFKYFNPTTVAVEVT